MAKKKLGMATIEVNKKFKDVVEAFRYAKRLNSFVRYVCKDNADKGWMAQSMIVVSNLKKDVSRLRYVNSGKRGRPRKRLDINERAAYGWYKGDYKTDYHLHILLVSKPSYAFRNVIKEYIDKNWFDIPNAYDKKRFGKKVYKKNCNIKMADYFIAQSEEVLFCNCNCGEEEDLKYSLKEYYREYLKVDSGKRRLYAKHRKSPMPEDKYLKELDKIEGKFNAIEKYYYDITKDKDRKEAEVFMKKLN